MEVSAEQECRQEGCWWIRCMSIWKGGDAADEVDAGDGGGVY